MEAAKKFNICKACKYSQRHPVFGVTCGTLDIISVPPVFGNTVWIDGKPVKLCGCVMKVKTALPNQSCPLSKW